MRIETLHGVGEPGLVEALQQLLGQLSSSAPPLTDQRVEELVDSEACTLFVARDDRDHLVGMLTLATFPVPSGVRAWIEDVVVAEAARGMGIGSALIREAIGHAQSLGARTVDLTSRPSREAANALYRRLGFVERDTNVYRFQHTEA